MVALLRGHNKAKIQSTGAVAGILVLPLLPMGWIHVIGKFLIYRFAIIIVKL
jgi:hypothetical protein